MSAPEMINAGEIVLKRLEPGWAGALAEAVQESLPELQPFLPWAGDNYGPQDSADFLEHAVAGWEKGTEFGYAIFTSTGDLIGTIGLMTRQGPGTLEIGYWLRTAYAGRGYMTAAVRALTRVALAIEPGVRVLILHDEANPASGAVARKAGFVEIKRSDREPSAPGESGIEILREYRSAVGAAPQ